MLKRGSLKYFFHFLIESLYLLFKKKQETKNKHGNSKNLGGRSLMILPPNDTTWWARLLTSVPETAAPGQALGSFLL